MNKILKYILISELVFIAIGFVCGFFEPAVWLWGIIFAVLPVSILMSIICIIFLERARTKNIPLTQTATIYRVLYIQLFLIILSITCILHISNGFWNGLGN